MQVTLNKSVHELMQETDTRWNSMCNMMARFLEQTALAAVDSKIESLTSWMFCGPTVANWIEAVQCYALATVLENTLLNLQFCLRWQMCPSIQQNQEQAQEHLVQRIWHQWMLWIAKKFFIVVSVLLLALPTLLDPRFKIVAFVRNTQPDEITRVLICKCSQIWSSLTAQFGISPPQVATSINTVHCDSCLIRILPRRICSTSHSGNSRWLSESCETWSHNPLKYWQRNEMKYPTLVQFMKKFFLYIYWSHVKSFFAKSGLSLLQ